MFQKVKAFYYVLIQHTANGPLPLQLYWIILIQYWSYYSCHKKKTLFFSWQCVQWNTLFSFNLPSPLSSISGQNKGVRPKQVSVIHWWTDIDSSSINILTIQWPGFIPSTVQVEITTVPYSSPLNVTTSRQTIIRLIVSDSLSKTGKMESQQHPAFKKQTCTVTTQICQLPGLRIKTLISEDYC